MSRATIRPVPPMDKVLDGDLSRFEVPDLLTFLSHTRRTGVLVLERRDQESKLFLRDGNPVFANSTKEELRFGGTVLRLGKLKAPALERALEKRRRDTRRLGQVLVADKVLNEHELAYILKVQVAEVIFETFAWPEGVFGFWDGVPPPPHLVTLEMDFQSLLMEGVRRIDARRRLGDAFPDRSLVVESLVNPERVKQSATLTPEEWKVFFLVDGRRSLSEICSLANSADLATLQILWNLVRARFVAIVPPAPEPAPSGPAGHGRVEFMTTVRTKKAEDDTKEIVTPKAVPYLDNAGTVTVSRLVLVQDGRETSFPLSRDTYTIGRHKNNDIVISDLKVSSFHARIDRTSEGFTVVDLKSRNGSYVNGRRIETAVLKTGDEVRMGTARLSYKVDYQSS